MNTDVPSPQKSASLRSMIIRGGVVAILAAGAYVFCRSSPSITTGTESGVIMNLPEIVDGFTGEDQPVSDSERHMLPKDTEFAKKVYKNFGGQQISSQIVLAGGEKRSIHRPEVCLRAQGWTLKTGETVPVVLDNGQTLDVMKLIIARPVEVRPGVQKELTSIFLYWFVGKNMTTPYHWERLAHTNWDRIAHNINHRWAYVIVSAPVLEGFVPGGKSQAETLELLKSFVAELAPEITRPSVHLAGTAK